MAAVSNLRKLFRAGGVLETAQNDRKTGPFYPKRHRKLAINHQQDYCLRAPVRTPVLQTAESALAKRYARHAPKAFYRYKITGFVATRFGQATPRGV